VFLNEKCKDALNITDFVNSLNISLSDLENVGEYGFVDGISKIFVKGLKSLDLYKRPIHCSDLKRETMHVKEQSGWEKDNENKDKLKKIVKMIAHKNMMKINDWKEKYPQYKNSDSKKNDQYLKILISSSGAYSKADEETDYNKIIRNLAKEVIIDKKF
jgi:transketolase